MKTGLITFHAAHHYGAMLQAYSLAASLGRIAGSCEIIDYVRPHTVGTNRIMERSFSPGSLLKNAHSLLHYHSMRRRFERFEAFVRDTMPLSPAHYSSSESLLANPPEYDRYICGSDQIWNPRIFDDNRFDPAFFLTFSNSPHKVAYAPSFGSVTLSENEETELSGYADTFYRLSAREAQGASVLERITGRPVPAVIDPTLLLTKEDWAALASPPPQKKPYVLCYFVSQPNIQLAYRAYLIKERLGAHTLQLAGTRRKISKADHVVFDAGPREFLSLFQNASYVLTNSFHGAVFAIQFEKPFMCTAGGGEDVSVSRTGSLLGKLGLSGRLLSGGQAPPFECDYSPVAERLKAERERSLSFLSEALTAEGV